MITTYVIIIAQGPGCLERPYPREEVFFHYGTMTERKNNVRREDKRRKYNVRNEENNISFAAHHSNGCHPVHGIRHLLPSSVDVLGKFRSFDRPEFQTSWRRLSDRPLAT